jgi:hypothetical protein
MDVRVLDLDGSLTRRTDLLSDRQAVPLRWWGPRLRLACSFGTFRHFEADLDDLLDPVDETPSLSFVGSGDFHHVSLALLRRLQTPFNLLILDNHPDWMRGLPFLHCGTWLHHAANLPLCRSVFHVGGDVDFDNRYRWLAPWPALRSGQLTVFPALRCFRGRAWAGVPHEPLRCRPDQPTTAWRLSELLDPYREELSHWPLYVSLDKDVLTAEEAIVNWDSGHLRLSEVLATLTAFVRAADGRLAGMDVVGDWSSVEVQGLFRKFFHWTEHPSLTVEADAAARVNERTNRTLLATLRSLGVLGRSRRTSMQPARRAA